MSTLRDDVKVTNGWSKVEAVNGETVDLSIIVSNLSTDSGDFKFVHAIPRGCTLLSMQAAGTVRQTSRRGIKWVGNLGPKASATLTLKLKLDIYLDDSGLPVPRLEAPRRVLDTLQIGEFYFAGPGFEYINPGQPITALLLVD